MAEWRPGSRNSRELTLWTPASRRQRELTGKAVSLSFETSEPSPKWCTSSSKVTTPSPPQINSPWVPSTQKPEIYGGHLILTTTVTVIQFWDLTKWPDLDWTLLDTCQNPLGAVFIWCLVEDLSTSGKVWSPNLSLNPGYTLSYSSV